MKTRWQRLIGAMLVVGIGAAAFTPGRTINSGASLTGAAGRRAAGPVTGQLSVADATLGLSKAGQPADEKPANQGPVVIQPDHMDVSPPLRDIEPAAAPATDPVLMRFMEGELLPGHEREGSFSGIEGVYQNWHGPAAMPPPIQNWDGVNNVGFSVRPPDTNGDVGPNHYVQWVNLRFQIWDKTGASLYGPAQGNTLWSGFGGQCQTTNDGDPVVLYDHQANRWVMMQFAITSTPNLLCFAVSQTADPLGSWYRYSYAWPSSYMPDYPKMGLWPDGYYVSVNQFTQAGSWRGAGALAMERSQMLTGAAAQAIYFDGFAYNPDFGGMLPADWDGSTQPPAGAPNPFTEWDDSAWIAPVDALRIWNFHVDWTTPANSYFGAPGTPFVPTYVIPTANVDPTLCSASPACINQPGTTVNLHDLADRLMHRLQYRNFGAYQTLVGNHTVDTNSPAGRAGIHWFELRNTGSGWTMNQEGTYGPADNSTTSRWMGSIAMDGAGNMALGYSITDDVSLYPSVRYAGRLSSDPSGTLPQSEATLVTGGGYQNDSFSRWGDYSAMQIDPTDDCTYWYTQEYAQTSGAYNWYTRIGSFKFNECGTPDFTMGATPASQEVCVGSNAAYSVAVGSISGYNSPVTLSTSGNPGTAGFSANPVNPPGNSTLTISGAAAGVYAFNLIGTAAGPNVHQIPLDLTVQAAAPGATTLTAPANNALNVPAAPTFTWNAAPGAASYSIQVATDAGFSNIVASATGLAAPTWTSNVTLNTSTLYYWRVQASNACGVGTYSSVFTFTTVAAPGDCTTGTTPNILYTDGFEAGIGGWTTPAGVGTNTWAIATTNPHSGVNHMRGLDPSSATDQRLVSPAIALPTGENPVVLKFWHVPNMENSGTTACFDGGILEVSSDGGTTWTQVPNANLLAGPYTGAISGSFGNPLAGLQAWCNGSAYSNVIADVSSYAGQTVQFRFRLGSDSSVSDVGWDVDDVTVQSCQTPTAVELSSVEAASSQSPVAPLAGLPLGALAATMLALGAGYALRRR
ncbi:MAG: hypothetical protein WA040_14250 [Anaerolineae bacterium]